MDMIILYDYKPFDSKIESHYSEEPINYGLFLKLEHDKINKNPGRFSEIEKHGNKWRLLINEKFGIPRKNRKVKVRKKIKFA